MNIIAHVLTLENALKKTLPWGPWKAALELMIASHDLYQCIQLAQLSWKYNSSNTHLLLRKLGISCSHLGVLNGQMKMARCRWKRQNTKLINKLYPDSLTKHNVRVSEHVHVSVFAAACASSAPPPPFLTTTKVPFNKVATVFGHLSHTRRSDSVHFALSYSSYHTMTLLKNQHKRNVIKLPCSNIY